MRIIRLAAALCVGLSGAALAQGAQGGLDRPVLFRVVGPHDEITIGMSAAEFDAMGPEPGVTRLARKLVSEGQVTAWRYSVGRTADGTTRLAPAGQVAILRNDTLRIEDYRAALPVAGPPR